MRTVLFLVVGVVSGSVDDEVEVIVVDVVPGTDVGVEGAVVVVMPEDVVEVGTVVVVLVGLTTVVNVVDEDVVDSDEMTPKSMSRRCSPSSRWT